MDARVESLIADIPSLSQTARLKEEMEKMEEYIKIFIESVPYAFGIVFIVSNHSEATVSEVKRSDKNLKSSSSVDWPSADWRLHLPSEQPGLPHSGDTWLLL